MEDPHDAQFLAPTRGTLTLAASDFGTIDCLARYCVSVFPTNGGAWRGLQTLGSKMKQGQTDETMKPEMMRGHYRKLGVNMALNLAIMYLVMFAMIWAWGEFYQNLNFFYMALMMWAPMGILMLLTMGVMYRDKKLNTALYAVFGLIFVLSFIGIRDQSLVGNRQFLRSMIPHHSGAITMCERASIDNPEIRQICFAPGGIVESQKREIAQMEALLER